MGAHHKTYRFRWQESSAQMRFDPAKGAPGSGELHPRIRCVPMYLNGAGSSRNAKNRHLSEVNFFMVLTWQLNTCVKRRASCRGIHSGAAHVNCATRGSLQGNGGRAFYEGICLIGRAVGVHEVGDLDFVEVGVKGFGGLFPGLPETAARGFDAGVR